MRIVQVAAEFSPIAKAGGLGEVIIGLSRELTRLGHQVEVILPKYDFISPHHLSNITLEVPDFKSLENGKQHANAMWKTEVEGCELHLLESRHPAGYFHRGKIYGCDDDIPRFLYFSRAVVEYLKGQKKKIDLLHLHDWHTSAIAPLIKDLFAQEIEVKGIVLTIHNVEYQGKCALHDIAAIGLHDPGYLTAAKMQDDHPSHPHTINLLKGGIVYSDAITTVSPSYAKEILTSAYGFGLDPTLRKNKTKLTGILNGIDQKLWDPVADPHLTTSYSSTDSLSKIFSAKETNKQFLANRFSLDPKARPWVGAITRLVSQKGPELLEQALKDTVAAGGTYVLLGSSPNPKLQQHFESLKKEYAHNPRVLLHLEYDETVAHQLYAALDLLLIPSHFEPCGLTQMIGLRYGTLPIARATGGLKDTIVDCENSLVPNASRNGFLFQQATPEALSAALTRAFHLYRSNPATFQNLMRHGMKFDFSWTKPAQQYLKLFEKVIKASQTPF